VQPLHQHEALLGYAKASSTVRPWCFRTVLTCTHAGDVCPCPRLSLTSNTAWGKRVISLRLMGRVGSLKGQQQHTQQQKR
jgi:hypothetical protein